MESHFRSFLFVAVLSSFLVSNPGRAQNLARDGGPVTSATIAAKKPVFAGACKACPWGILARVTADALRFYGYETTIVHTTDGGTSWTEQSSEHHR